MALRYFNKFSDAEEFWNLFYIERSENYLKEDSILGVPMPKEYEA